jgi:hypothetical protein
MCDVVLSDSGILAHIVSVTGAAHFERQRAVVGPERQHVADALIDDLSRVAVQGSVSGCSPMKCGRGKPSSRSPGYTLDLR